jgi:16S rRNA (guanine966-N2)-methyltransferase
MTRIIAGSHGGRRLAAPPGSQTRPTADRVREALFSSLSTLVDLDGARFADFYAGSGAVGLEALSRGVTFVLLVESDAKASRIIRDNIATLRAGAAARLVTGRVGSVVAGPPEGGPFDVVFADPPYGLDDAELADMQRGLVDNGWLAPDAVLAIERSTRSVPKGGTLSWVDGVTAERSRRYGETTLWYGRRS